MRSVSHADVLSKQSASSWCGRIRKCRCLHHPIQTRQPSPFVDHATMPVHVCLGWLAFHAIPLEHQIHDCRLGVRTPLLAAIDADLIVSQVLAEHLGHPPRYALGW